VLGAHGTQGELRVRSDSDFAAERLCRRGTLWLRRPRRRAPRRAGLIAGRKGPGTGMWLVTLEDVSTREQAAALRGASFHVRREQQPALEPDEIMLWQLEGLDVVRAPASDSSDRPLEVLGRVVGAIPREEITGDPNLGHDLLEIAIRPRSDEQRGQSDGDGDQEGDSDNGEGDDGDDMAEADPDTVLVPYVPQIVVSVRLEDGVVLVEPPEGLLDLIQPKRTARVVIRGLLPAVAASLQEREA